jgi:hypothetical protein
MILPEADLAAAIPRRQFARLDAALKYFHHRLLAGVDARLPRRYECEACRNQFVTINGDLTIRL